MRSAITVAALCCFLLNIGLAQVKPTPSLQPTRLEAFAGQPNAHVTWSKEVGQIKSDEAHVVVTALMIKDAMAPQRMCGVRIDLSNQNAKDQVYLEAAKLEGVRKALEEIESGIAGYHKEPSNTPYRYYGAAEFWHPHLRLHTLNAAYYIAPDSSGLSLSAYKGHGFRFPDHRPSELAKAISLAMEELKRHCAS